MYLWISAGKNFFCHHYVGDVNVSSRKEYYIDMMLDDVLKGILYRHYLDSTSIKVIT